MKRNVVLITLLLACALVGRGSAVDATSAWNDACANYQFQTTSEATLGCTFHEAYLGTEALFDSRFAALVSAVGNVCGVPTVPPDGDEAMHAKLANW